MVSRVLDSHIHLWPASASNTTGHKWMQPGFELSREHSISQYLDSCGGVPCGFVYVETDRALPKSPEPGRDVSDEELCRYAEQPLEEIRFLRRIVEGEGASEGNAIEHKELMQGIVLWAPLHLGPKILARYLLTAEQTAGPSMWKMVRGFRVLLQAIRGQDDFRRLVTGDHWIESLAELGARGFTFDVGVDQRSGGVWQLEILIEMVTKLGLLPSPPKLILNHLCKPDIRGQLQTPEQLHDYAHWVKVIEVLARFPSYPGIYMKLSGAFSEMQKQDESSPLTADTVATQLKPWVDVVFDTFGPRRVMFGSDWPVCNVGGPGEKNSWRSWHDFVEKVVEDRKLTLEETEGVWYGAACEAYAIK